MSFFSRTQSAKVRSGPRRSRQRFFQLNVFPIRKAARFSFPSPLILSKTRSPSCCAFYHQTSSHVLLNTDWRESGRFFLFPKFPFFSTIRHDGSPSSLHAFVAPKCPLFHQYAPNTVLFPPTRSNAHLSRLLVKHTSP